MKSAAELLDELKVRSDPNRLVEMRRYGIHPESALGGISIPVLRALARGNRDHGIALELWASGYHEARLLAGMVEEPSQTTSEQMDQWVRDFDAWDVCDGVCFEVFDKTPYAVDKVYEWAESEHEYIRRASFALMAGMAIHRKELSDVVFLGFLPLIKKHSIDGRNFVKKAVNWALRQIGKRSRALHGPALTLAHELATSSSPAARWTGRDAVRELTSPAILARLNKKTIHQ